MMWSANRGLNQLVADVVCHKQTERLHELEAALGNSRPQFISLLKDSPRKPRDRELLKKASKEPLSLVGIDRKITLGEDFIEEAIILSDLFEMNEILTVELLLAAEGQLPSYPDLTRGLVAVLLYFDSRRCLVDSLRNMIQARRGRTWSVDLPDEVLRVIHSFTDDLWKNELLKKILDLLSSLDMKQTIEQLEKVRGLGRARHRHQFRTLYSAVRNGLAECLLMWSCQTPLERDDFLLLMDYVNNNLIRTPSKSSVGVTRRESSAVGGGPDNIKPIDLPDRSGILILMSSLYALDVSQLESSWDVNIDHDAEEDAKAAVTHPALVDQMWVTRVHDSIRRLKVPTAGESSESGPVSLIKLGWSQSLRRLAQCVEAEWADVTEDDETLAEASIEEGVFTFVRQLLHQHIWFFSDEYCMRRLHGIITDFLVQMPLRVKELRNRGDETARLIEQCQRDGTEPPKHLRRDFEELMLMVGELYAGDKLELCVDYWCQQDPLATSPNVRGPQGDLSTSMFGQTGVHAGATRLSYKQLSLYKFVRLAGDLVLMPALYIPYLRMLQGLSNSRYAGSMCYSLLKANASVGGLQSGVVSWDHFFRSLHLYLSAMRQELSSGAAMLAVSAGAGSGLGFSSLQPMQYTPHLYYPTGRVHKGITPQEMDGLRNVLVLMRKVIGMDEVARASLVENPDWQPVSLFFGLLSCSVPINLKAEMLETLAIFARTSQNALNILRAFEASQILATPSAGLARQRVSGLHTELDETEPKSEEYPLARGFLMLLTAISEHFLPQQLPGSSLHDLIRFTYETLFLKHAMRAYKNPGERWQVAALCLNLFDIHLNRYLSAISELTNRPSGVANGSQFGAGPGLSIGTGQSADPDGTQHPGFLIGCQFLTDSPLLKLLLGLAHEGLQELDDYIPDKHPNPKVIEVLIAALQLLDRVLERQEDLLRVIRAQHSLISSIRLSKLLMGVNSKTGRPDHLVNIVRLASFLEDAPNLARLGLSVLSRCVNLVQPHRDLLTVLTADWNTRTEILRSLVDCLETDLESLGEDVEDVDDPDAVPNGDIEQPGSTAFQSPRLLVLEILLSSLENPWPNLGHFLLGFRIDRQVRRTVLQEPGVMGFPKTCLHALFSVIEACSDRLLGGQFLSKQQLWEFALSTRTLYRLAVNTDTCEATLRFCRHSRDLFLSQMPCLRRFPQESDPARLGLLLYQKSWMMRLLAIELHINSLTNQRLGLQALSRQLLGNDGMIADERGNWFERITFENADDDKVLLSVFNQLSLTVSLEAPMPDCLQHLNIAYFDELVGVCEHTNALGTKVVDVRRLQALMRHEIAASISELAPNQADAVRQEFEGACKIAEDNNRLRLWLHGKQACLEGWRQVVEVLVVSCPHDLLPWATRKAVIIDLLVHMLSDLAEESTPAVMRPLLSGTALNLFSELSANWVRHAPGREREADSGVGALGRSTMAAMEFVSLLDTSLQTHAGSSEAVQESAQLRVVLMRLLESIGTSSASSQRVRANLYASLSHLLYIARMQDSVVGSRLTRECLEVVPRMGERLFDSICRDAADGHHVTRMCALAVLDRLLYLDRFSELWLGHLVRLGYLQNLIDGLIEDGRALEELVQIRRPSSLAPLFIYQSKMALLCRVAIGSAAGAKALTAAGIMSRLAECPVYSLRPPNTQEEDSLDDSNVTIDFLPNLSTRYWQILEPALRLAFNLMTSLGLENQQAGQSVLTFLDAHSDALLGSLYFAANQSNAASSGGSKVTDFSAVPGETFTLLRLRELALVTSLLHLTSFSDAEGDPEEMEGWRRPFGHRESLNARVRRVAFALLPVFAGSLKDKNGTVVSNIALALEEKRSLRYSILCSLLSYIGTCLRTRCHFSPATITFSSELRPLSDREPSAIMSTKTDSLTRSRPPLRLLTSLLRDAQACLNVAIDSSATRSTKLRQLSELTSEEIRLLANDLGASGASDDEVCRRLEKLVTFLERQVLHLTAIVEHSCYLLWAHIDYYLNRRELQPAIVCETLAECLPCDTTLKRFSRGDADRIEYMESFVRKLRRLAASVQFM